MRAIPRTLPLVLVLLAGAGIAAAAVSISVDQSARDWYAARLGGSTLYLLSVTFARILPFLIGAAIAIALIQRQRPQTGHARSGDRVQRHEWTELIGHWINAAGIIIGLVTAAFLLRWVDSPLSKEATYALHYVGAGLVVVVVAHHLAYHLIGGGSGLIPRSLTDARNALAESIGYLGVYRGLRGAFGVQLPIAARRPIGRVLRALRIVPDPAGKFLATEKVISYPVWAVLIGVVVLTGIVKAMHYVWALPGWLRQGATFLHDGATIFMIVFLVFHVAALVLVPRNWPLLTSMFTTRISRRYVDEHLPEWAAELDGRPPRSAE